MDFSIFNSQFSLVIFLLFCPPSFPVDILPASRFSSPFFLPLKGRKKAEGRQKGWNSSVAKEGGERGKSVGRKKLSPNEERAAREF